MAEIVKADERMLLRLDTACRALAEARSIDEVKDIRDQARAIEHYLKQRDYGNSAHLDAGEIRLRAERRLGKLLEENIRHRGGRPKKNADNESAFLPDGVHQKQSQRWQKVAELGDAEFDSYVSECRERGDGITTAGAVKKAKAKAKKSKRQAGNAACETCTVDDLRKLVAAGKKFGTVYADPPWKYGNQATRASTDNHYATMTVEEIAALPVGDLAAKDCHLHLWTTNAFLFECPRLFAAWGFEYKSVFVWVKPQMGIGNYWRVSHEFLLLAVRGKADFGARDEMSWMVEKRQEHSAKPHTIRQAVERVSPGPRLELFGRGCVDGWTVWGDAINRLWFDANVEAL